MKLGISGPFTVRVSAVLLLALGGLAVLFFPPGSQGQTPSRNTIESIQFRGNRRVPSATMRARIFSQPGDPYDENALRRDFMALYNTGLFEDIVLSVEPGETGRIVIFEVRERPVIRTIDYVGNKSVTQSDILDRFKERNVGLTVESRYDPTRIKRAEVVLKQLLAERGRQLATVTTETRQIPPSSVALTFRIDEGPKVKVGKISFEGNTVISDRKLRRAMRNSRPYGVPYSLVLADLWNKTYDKNKLDQDLEFVRGAYQDRGYFKVLVNEPRLQNRDTGGGAFRIPWLYPNRPGRAVDVTIPIVEGEKYVLGDLTFRNSTLFRDTTVLRTLFDMKQGEVFNVSKVRKGLEELRKLYGEFGYINFVPEPETIVDDQARRIHLNIGLDEGKQFTVRRIEFSGNTTTRDKVIRRELLLQEGSLFNSRLWELSLLRLNQLDYFEKLEPDKAAEVQPNNAEGTVDIALKVQEKGKNTIGFSGGVSGLSGSFVGFNYQTNNFMGLGETLTFDAQLGSLERNVLIGLTHPYLFDRPLTAGFTIYSRRYNFNEGQQASLLTGQDLTPIFDLLGSENIQNYRESSVGFTAFASYPIRNNFTRLGLSYGYESSSVRTFSQISRLLFENINFRGLGGVNSLEGIRTSKIIPTYHYSTVDSPLFATRGMGLFASLELAGIGGNVRYYRPAVDFKWFHPFTGGGRTFGMHFYGATMSGYGGRVIPPFARSYTGGENNIRGFDINTISPIGFLPDTTAITVLNANGTVRITSAPDAIGAENRAVQTQTIPINRITFPGGDTTFISNFQYRIPLFGPVHLSFFADAGINLVWKRDQLQITEQRLLELSSQFPSVDFKKQIELAGGTNNQWRASTGVELSVLMPVVNAPFRIYWAYNPLRLKTNISPPPLVDPALFPNQATYNSAIQQFGSPIPYAEPASTFRFTIGTTF
ncbi:MAG TPA: outer membrane protein assembly factor BamA [Terriglobia bacterium]|nr:outer membrane protein assembly factor BamA [Terriglobia bacterium]